MVKEVHIDPKIRFLPQNILTLSFLNFYLLTTQHLLACVWKKIAPRPLGYLWPRPMTTNGTTLNKDNFPYTHDLWPVVTMWPYINVDLWYYHIPLLNKFINVSLIIYLLLINIWGSNSCFSHRNVFQNGVNTFYKTDNHFLPKNSKFCKFGHYNFVQTAPACGLNLTIIWVMVWLCGNVCKRLPQLWSKRREMHKKGRENPEEGSNL